MISTDAWVLHRGAASGPGRLVHEVFTFADPGPDEVLARPLFGCWEGNMDLALRRSPVDVCALRGEPRVVLGNAGVVEVLDVGPAVRGLAAGDVCMVFCTGTPDEQGYPTTIMGYDAPGTMGVLAKTIKLKPSQLIPIPRTSTYSLPQWAAFSLRYVTAWANWRVAYACWKAQMDDVPPEATFVYGWGGGVALAQLTLAQQLGCQSVMITSKPARRALLESLGVGVLERDGASEASLLDAIRRRTAGRGVSIFVDNIGSSYRMTMKALGRQGIITTTGWKHGMTFPVVRAAECIARHIHVFTHYARYAEGVAAVNYALDHGWIPTLTHPIYAWSDIPRLADDYAGDRIDDYFPVFAIA